VPSVEPPSDYNSVIENLLSPPPGIGYYGYIRMKSRLEEMFARGEIPEKDYIKGVEIADYQIKYFEPEHDYGAYIDSISLWRWSDCQHYVGASPLPQWMVRTIAYAWKFDHDYPSALFPAFLYQELSKYIKDMPPDKCFDFSIRYVTGFDPRTGLSKEAFKEEKEELTGTEEKPPKKTVTVTPPSLPSVMPDLINQIQDLSLKQEKTQENINTLAQKLNEIMERIKKREIIAGEQTPTNAPLNTEEDDSIEMSLSPSELQLLNRNNPSKENGKTIWHDIKMIRKVRNLTQVIISRDLLNETPEEFKNWIDGINEKIAELKGKRTVSKHKSIYELKEYSMDREGWKKYADTVLQNLPKECYIYRLGNESRRRSITGMIIYALNLYLEDIEQDADASEMHIDFDYMDGSFFPIKQICEIIEKVNQSDAKNKQAIKLEKIGELVSEWSGTEEGRPALRP